MAIADLSFAQGPPSTVIERPHGRPRETPREPDDKPPEPLRPSRRSPPKPEASDEMLDARLSFLEDRIGKQRKHAEIWWGSWLTFYTMGAIVQSARALDAKEPAERADLWISTAKATFGVVSYMAQPFRGIEGFEPVPTTHMGRARKEERVRQGERVLVHNADKTHKFGPWYAHVINIGINGLGGAIVAIGFDDPRTGLISAGIGAAVGEVAIFTAPWEADDDLEEYKTRFGRSGDVALARPTTPTVEWKVRPTANGALLVGNF
jgi:hypothetical protein